MCPDLTGYARGQLAVWGLTSSLDVDDSSGDAPEAPGGEGDAGSGDQGGQDTEARTLTADTDGGADGDEDSVDPIDDASEHTHTTAFGPDKSVETPPWTISIISTTFRSVPLLEGEEPKLQASYAIRVATSSNLSVVDVGVYGFSSQHQLAASVMRIDMLGPQLRPTSVNIERTKFEGNDGEAAPALLSSLACKRTGIEQLPCRLISSPLPVHRVWLLTAARSCGWRTARVRRADCSDHIRHSVHQQSSS